MEILLKCKHFFLTSHASIPAPHPLPQKRVCLHPLLPQSLAFSPTALHKVLHGLMQSRYHGTTTDWTVCAAFIGRGCLEARQNRQNGLTQSNHHKSLYVWMCLQVTCELEFVIEIVMLHAKLHVNLCIKVRGKVM